jgi:hypothetical protein
MIFSSKHKTERIFERKWQKVLAVDNKRKNGQIIKGGQIRKFLGSFRYRKSANFLDVPVRMLQICTFLMINLQIGKFPWCPSPQIAN